jgi:microcompartment protein CcmK/EutM
MFVACDNVKAGFGNAALVHGCKEGRQQGFTYACALMGSQ